MKIRHTSGKEKIELQMTPMIDIVFQLLVFFIMTFKIVMQEGDFNIKMPLAAPRENVPDVDFLPPMKLRMTANEQGELTNMQMGERVFGDFQQLRGYIMSQIGEDTPGSIREAAEVELDCDFALRYEYVIAAITAVSGHVTPEGDVVKLVEKIKFAPLREAG